MSKTATAAPELKLSENILSLAESISQRLTMDKKTGIAAVPEKTFVELMPEGITEDLVKSVNEYTMNMAAASLHALGEAALPVFKKNADLAMVSMVVPMVGKDELNASFKRQSFVPGKDEAGNPASILRYGTSSVSITNHATNAGEIKKVKKHWAEMMQASLSK